MIFSEIFWIFNTNNEQEGTSSRDLYRANRYDADPDPPNLLYDIPGEYH